MADSKRIRTVTDECKPPDGGFGWVVALGSFIVFVVIGGQAYSFGVLYVEFIDAFGASKASTAWIGALYFSPGIVSFPLSMALINKYGYRTVAMIGGILSSIGLFATSFATSIGQIYFIYGIFTGLWHWFLLLPALAIIRRYFTNRLPLALGFALSGTGAGQFVVSFTAQVLVDEYGWRGTLLILSALNLNICVAGALYRPIEVYHCIKQKKNKSMNTQVYEKGISTSNNEDIENVPENGRYSAQLDSEVELNPTYMSLFDQRESNLQAEVIDNVKERAKGSEAPGCFANCKTNLKGAFDWSLFTNMAFVLIIVSGFGTQAGNYAAISHIVKRGRDYGIPSLRSSSLPALMGMTQFLGRIFWGILGGVSKKLKPAMLYGVSIAVAGTASIISIHTSTYTGQLVFVILLGVSMACFIPVFPVVLHQLLDTSKVDHAMMFYLQAQSIGATLASPVAGWMRDIEGDYDGAYYLIGMLYIVSAICAFLAPVADKYIVNRKKERSEGKCSNYTKGETEGNSQ